MSTVFTITIADDTRGQQAGKTYTMSDEDGQKLFDAYKAIIDNSRNYPGKPPTGGPPPDPATDDDAVRLMLDTAMNGVNSQAHGFVANMKSKEAFAAVVPPATIDEEIPATALPARPAP